LSRIKGIVTIIPPLVFVIGSFILALTPVNGPPRIISPYSLSIVPVLFISSSIVVPMGTSLYTLDIGSSLKLPTIVIFFDITGFLNSIASVILVSVSTLITTASAADGN